MNKHNRQKSREIRAIMRTDKWGRMTYKEARRDWRKGTRVIWFNPNEPYMEFDNSKMNLSHNILKAFAPVYHEILKYAGERHLWTEYEYDPIFHAFKLRLSGHSFTGQRFGGYMWIAVHQLEYALSAPKDLARYLLEYFDNTLYKNGFYPPKPLCHMVEIPEDPYCLTVPMKKFFDVCEENR